MSESQTKSFGFQTSFEIRTIWQPNHFQKCQNQNVQFSGVYCNKCCIRCFCYKYPFCSFYIKSLLQLICVLYVQQYGVLSWNVNTVNVWIRNYSGCPKTGRPVWRTGHKNVRISDVRFGLFYVRFTSLDRFIYKNFFLYKTVYASRSSLV